MTFHFISSSIHNGKTCIEDSRENGDTFASLQAMYEFIAGDFKPIFVGDENGKDFTSQYLDALPSDGYDEDGEQSYSEWIAELNSDFYASR